MSKMGELVYAIQEDLDAGILSFNSIAEKHDVPVSWVNEVYDEYVPQLDCDDSDDNYALASAGWGTDEDYGCSSEY